MNQSQNSYDDEVPGWLLAALPSETGSPEFLARCTEASRTARELFLLRHASRRLGRSLLSIPAYLRGLSGVARVSLDHVLQWAGLDMNADLDADFSKGWSRVARALGLELEDALWHLRLTFAERAGLELPMIASRDSASLLAELDDYLSATFAEEDAHLADRFQQCARIVQQEYRADLE